MIEFLCLPHAAPFCASTTYAPTVQVGSLYYRGGLYNRAIPADADVRARLGVEVIFGFPDVGRPRQRAQVQEVCEGDRCIRFVMECDASGLSCSWGIAGPNGQGGFSTFNYISLTAVSRQAMESALDNLAFDLGEGIRVPLSAIVDAPHLSVD
jgi:hypothetical protein